MDTGAELTLQIVHRAQAHVRSDLARPSDRWLFWPRGERLDWDGARARLGAEGKPLLIAPLLEPGMLGLWTVESLDERQKEVVARGIANQQQYYAEKLDALRVGNGPVRFGTGRTEYAMSRGEFLHWASEYAINVGISLEVATDGDGARVRLRSSVNGPPLVV